MSTKDGIIDLEYKVGVTDDVGIRFEQENGIPLDLEGSTIVFNIADKTNHTFSVPCSLGGWYQGSYYNALQGGMTINFSDIYLTIQGEYVCEFVATKDGDETVIPSDNDYYILKVYSRVPIV